MMKKKDPSCDTHQQYLHYIYQQHRSMEILNYDENTLEHI